jgi:2Fe-2S ferredoxin
MAIRHEGVAMPKVVYVGDDGVEVAVDAAIGESVMLAATKNGVPGIIGECGGNASCGTCHVWVREPYFEQVGPPGEELEEDLLDLGVSDRRDNSRLSCQIEVTPDLDGLTVDVPPEQP